jgi:hypothetical protein
MFKLFNKKKETKNEIKKVTVQVKNNSPLGKHYGVK